MWLGLCVLFMQTLQAPPLAVIVRSEGGINPSEEKVTFFHDGRVLLEFWSLAQRERRQEFRQLTSGQLAQLKVLLSQAQKAPWPTTLNQTHGPQTAFAVTFTWWWQGKERSVTGFTFGEPPWPEEFGKMAEELFTLAHQAAKLSSPR